MSERLNPPAGRSASLVDMDWRDRLPEGMGPVEHEGDDITGTVSLPVDPDGYFGRQCPECERPFKLVAAEYKALPDDLILTCAYCGHEADHGDYMTPQQRERAVAGMHALAEQFLHQQVSDMLGSVFGNGPRVRPGESGVEMSYTPGSPPPVAALPSYVEERTVRSLQCAGCGNHYAVYGAAAFCPICGPRPSIDTVRESLAAARQTLQLEDELPTTMRQAMRAEGVFDQLAAHAVKSTVTLFEVYANDQFGRRVPTAARSYVGAETSSSAWTTPTRSTENRRASRFHRSFRRTCGIGCGRSSPSVMSSSTATARSTSATWTRSPARASAWGSSLWSPASKRSAPSTTWKHSLSRWTSSRKSSHDGGAQGRIVRAPASDGRRKLGVMAQTREVEMVFEPQDEGGYHVYAPDLPGLHTQGDTLAEAELNAKEALALYVEGLHEQGRSLDSGIIRRTFPLSA